MPEDVKPTEEELTRNSYSRVSTHGCKVETNFNKRTFWITHFAEGYDTSTKNFTWQTLGLSDAWSRAKLAAGGGVFSLSLSLSLSLALSLSSKVKKSAESSSCPFKPQGRLSRATRQLSPHACKVKKSSESSSCPFKPQGRLSRATRQLSPHDA
jgi:hypothetical protein